MPRRERAAQRAGLVVAAEARADESTRALGRYVRSSLSAARLVRSANEDRARWPPSGVRSMRREASTGTAQPRDRGDREPQEVLMQSEDSAAAGNRRASTAPARFTYERSKRARHVYGYWRTNAARSSDASAYGAPPDLERV